MQIAKTWTGILNAGVHISEISGRRSPHRSTRACREGLRAQIFLFPAASEPQVHMTCVTAIITFGAAAVKRVEVAPLG